MSLRIVVPALLGLLLLAACSDDPVSPRDPSRQDDDEDIGITPPDTLTPGFPDSIPHDFVVTTDPQPAIPGEAAQVTIRWTDSNLNRTSIGMQMEGGTVISGWACSVDYTARQYQCSQWMVLPDSVANNILYVHVGDPDSSVVYQHPLEIAGGFEPPANTPPYEVWTKFLPWRITPGQVASLSLNGKDDENNMAEGMTVQFTDGAEITPLSATQFLFNPDAHVFSYRMDFLAPSTPGQYQIDITVQDLEGEVYDYAAEFVVEGPNQAPYFTDVQIEDRAIDGLPDSLAFRVAAIDPEGDQLHLLYSASYAGVEKDQYYGEVHGDTLVWTGTITPRQDHSSQVTFRLFDGNVEVEGETFHFPADPGGLPVLTRYTVTDGDGLTRQFDPFRNAYLDSDPGEAWTFELSAFDPQGDPLTYEWFLYVDNEKDPQTSTDPTFTPIMPNYPCSSNVFCHVRDPDGNVSSVRPTIFTVR